MISAVKEYFRELIFDNEYRGLLPETAEEVLDVVVNGLDAYRKKVPARYQEKLYRIKTILFNYVCPSISLIYGNAVPDFGRLHQSDIDKYDAVCGFVLGNILPSVELFYKVDVGIELDYLQLAEKIDDARDTALKACLGSSIEPFGKEEEEKILAQFSNIDHLISYLKNVKTILGDFQHEPHEPK